jgi:hypothetical protein
MQSLCCYFTFCKIMTLKTLRIVLISATLASVDINVAVALLVCMSARLLLPTVGNEKVQQ